MPIPVKLDASALKELGQEFVSRLDDVDHDKTTLLQDTLTRALKNYEGKASIKNFPWPGASNVVVPITTAHTDAIAARIYNASVAHDPMFMLSASRGGEIVPGFSYEDLSKALQKASWWIEKEGVRYADFIEELILTFCIYGDAYVHTEWQHFEVKGMEEDVEGKPVEYKEDIINRPVLTIVHPKDFLCPVYEREVKTASWCGYNFLAEELYLRNQDNYGVYASESVKSLLEWLGKARSTAERKYSGTYFKEWGGRYYTPDEFEREKARQIGVNADAAPNALRMANVYARIDVDGDGIPEDINFHVHRDSGIIPYIVYAQRPFEHFYYSKRPGSIFNKGVPELLFNIQRILNSVMRDILDNNKVQNTKVFVIRKGAPVERNMRVYPGRNIFVDNVETDFKPMDMGTGRPISSVQDVVLLQQWGERLTGITDFNLGREGKSRTPASSTLTLIQEGGQRIERTIDRMRTVLRDLHYRVLKLYLRYGNVEEMAIASDEPRLVAAWASIQPRDLEKVLVVSPEVSTSNLNRTLKRQEALTLFAQLDQYYQKLTLLAQAMGQFGNDATMQELFIRFAKGAHRVMDMVLDTFDIRDQAELNPDFVSLLQKVENAGIQPVGSSPTGSSPAQASQGILGNQAGGVNQLEAVGRPPAGLPRVPGSTSGVTE